MRDWKYTDLAPMWQLSVNSVREHKYRYLLTYLLTYLHVELYLKITNYIWIEITTFEELFALTFSRQDIFSTFYQQ